MHDSDTMPVALKCTDYQLTMSHFEMRKLTGGVLSLSWRSSLGNRCWIRSILIWSLFVPSSSSCSLTIYNETSLILASLKNYLRKIGKEKHEHCFSVGEHLKISLKNTSIKVKNSWKGFTTWFFFSFKNGHRFWKMSYSFNKSYIYILMRACQVLCIIVFNSRYQKINPYNW